VFYRKSPSDVECQVHAPAPALGILAAKVVSQTPAAAEEHVDSFSVSAKNTLVVLWNLVVKLLSSCALKAPRFV